MKKVAVFLTSHMDFERLLASGIPEIHDGSLIPVIFQESTYLQQAEQLIAKDVRAFIVRGGYYYLVSRTLPEFPVLQLQVSRGDIMTALLEVRGQYKNVYLLLREQENLPTYNYNALLDMDYTLYLEHYIDGKKEIELMREFLSRIPPSEDTIVVGGALVVKYAEEFGLHSKFICTTPEQIIQLYHAAQELLEQLGAEQRSVEQRNLVMDSVETGIAILNEERQISHVNVAFEQLTGQSSVALIGNTPETVFENYAANTSRQTQAIEVNEVPLMARESIKRSESGEIFSILTLERSQKEHPLTKCSEKRQAADDSFALFHTRDKKVQQLVETAKQYASTQLPILIVGASGTGKSSMARSIHSYSKRSGDFIELNCAALSAEQLAPALFGDARTDSAGALEKAENGTVYLSEINRLPISLQARLLQALKDQAVFRCSGAEATPIHTRLITSTTVDLLAEIRSGRFRDDLYYWLNVLDLTTPLLKERKKDILMLFRASVAETLGCTQESVTLSDALANKLLQYDWPGNLTQLQSCAYKYAFSYDKEGFDFSQLVPAAYTADAVIRSDLSIDLKQLNKVVEDLVIDSLAKKGMSKTEIAKTLGISRTALYNKLDPGRKP